MMGKLSKYIDGWLEFKDNSKVLAKVSRSVSRTLSNIYDEAFCKHSSRLKATHSENKPSSKTESALKKYKYVYLSNWYIKSTIYKRFLYSNQISKK